jgi:hypothetical protein
LIYIDAPLGHVLVDLLLDVVGDELALLEEVLEDELPAGVLEDGVGDFGNGHVEVLDSVEGVPRIDNAIVYRRIDVQRNVVLRDDVLCGRGSTCRARSSTLIFMLIIPSVSVQGFM